jgi:DNA replication protein DnaC
MIGRRCPVPPARRDGGDQLRSHFTSAYLPRLPRAVPHLSPLLLEQLAQEEAQARSRRSLERRLRRSGIKKFKVMADVEWSWPKTIERQVIEEALTLSFLREARNFILIGPNGLGKSMIAKNICHLAVLAGYSVLFRTAAAIVEDLRHEMFEGHRRKLRGYGKVDLLCIDECAYLSFDDKAADILYEVINRRYESKSVILTTNRSFKEWNQVFPHATCIATLLDRLLHHADVTRLDAKVTAFEKANWKPWREGKNHEPTSAR